jgi:hypothetical protein
MHAVPSQVVKDSVELARLEGLEGHARSAECRLTEPPAAKKAKTNGTA